MSDYHAYLLPHPPLALPAIGRGEERKIAKTLSAMDKVAAEIAAFAPQTIIFISPHATVYGDYFHISPGKGATGDFARFGFGDIKMTVEYDEKLAAEITRAAEAHSIPAGTDGARDPSLDHGVMVPLWYIRQRYTDFKIVRISPSGLDAEAHYNMGQCIAEACVKKEGGISLTKPHGEERDISPPRIVLIASGDLSHSLADRGPYAFTPEGPVFDKIVCDAFSSGDLQALFDKALPLRKKAAECGLAPCMILAGFFHGMRVKSRLLSYEGPFGVGYAVAAVDASPEEHSRPALPGCDCSANAALPLDATQYTSTRSIPKTLSPVCPCPYLSLARHALENRVLGKPASLPPCLPPELTDRQAGAFVSLHKHGQLRGCIGTIAPTCDNIALEIMQNAVSAGLRDNRFNPITPDELPHLTYKVDILSAPEPIASPGELDVKRYGVIVTSGYRRGLLLPNLDGINSVEQQIIIAMQKAGIRTTDPVELERFEVVRYE